MQLSDACANLADLVTLSHIYFDRVMMAYTFKCVICSQFFTNRKKLFQHLNQHINQNHVVPRTPITDNSILSTSNSSLLEAENNNISSSPILHKILTDSRRITNPDVVYREIFSSVSQTSSAPDSVNQCMAESNESTPPNLRESLSSGKSASDTTSPIDLSYLSSKDKSAFSTEDENNFFTVKREDDDSRFCPNVRRTFSSSSKYKKKNDNSSTRFRKSSTKTTPPVKGKKKQQSEIAVHPKSHFKGKNTNIESRAGEGARSTKKFDVEDVNMEKKSIQQLHKATLMQNSEAAQFANHYVNLEQPTTAPYFSHFFPFLPQSFAFSFSNPLNASTRFDEASLLANKGAYHLNSIYGDSTPLSNKNAISQRESPNDIQDNALSSEHSQSTDEDLLRNKENILTCNYCKNVFSDICEVRQHMSLHKKELKPYKCKYCSYLSRTGSQLKVHMKRHKGIKAYICFTCNYSGVTQSDLNRHMKSQSHGCKALNTCAKCRIGFMTKYILDHHDCKSSLLSYLDSSNKPAVNPAPTNTNKHFTKSKLELMFQEYNVCAEEQSPVLL